MSASSKENTRIKRKIKTNKQGNTIARSQDIDVEKNGFAQEYVKCGQVASWFVPHTCGNRVPLRARESCR